MWFRTLSHEGQNYWTLIGWERGHFFLIKRAWLLDADWLRTPALSWFPTSNGFWKNFGNRPLAPRGHMTNASLEQWVVILLLPQIDRTHKDYLTPEIWEETHLREIFYGTFIFQQSSMICIGRHVGGRTIALQHGGQNYFFAYIVLNGW